MRIFLDTEFTDFTNPRLLSAGLVTEDGREFYCELTDGWEKHHCSEFVLDTVLPLFTGGDAAMTRQQAGAKLVAWLTTLSERHERGQRVVIVSDTETDGHLVQMLIYPHVHQIQLEIDVKLLSWPGHAMARRHEDLLEELLGNEPSRHHALVDARALKTAVLQTEAEFRAG